MWFGRGVVVVGVGGVGGVGVCGSGAFRRAMLNSQRSSFASYWGDIVAERDGQDGFEYVSLRAAVAPVAVCKICRWRVCGRRACVFM